MDKIIFNGIPFGGNLLISVGTGEIPVSPGDFWRMRQANMFVSVIPDNTDILKLVGTDKDGTVFVSEKIDEDMSDIELKEYEKRLRS